MAPFAVVLGGSRSLGASALPLVSSVVSRLSAFGASAWSVGCSSGGDALALSALSSAGLCPAVSVFAVGGPAGSGFAGFWSGSAVGAVSAAVAAGARPLWWAGGPASVPLRVRLARRSAACVCSVPRGCVGGSVGVWFLSSSSSVGSLGAARLAAGRGVAVFVFCVGFPGSSVAPLVPGGASFPAAVCPLPPLVPGGGAWFPVGAGPLAGGWRWVRG